MFTYVRFLAAYQGGSMEPFELPWISPCIVFQS